MSIRSSIFGKQHRFNDPGSLHPFKVRHSYDQSLRKERGIDIWAFSWLSFCCGHSEDQSPSLHGILKINECPSDQTMVIIEKRRHPQGDTKNKEMQTHESSRRRIESELQNLQFIQRRRSERIWTQCNVWINQMADYWTETKHNELIYKYCEVMLHHPDYKEWRKEYCVIAICTADNIEDRMEMMYKLTDLCECRELLLSLKMVKRICKIMTLVGEAVVDPVFMKTVWIKKKCFTKSLKDKKCRNYMKLCTKYRSCSGCMETIYCNKKCQKRHWKQEHRELCNGSWIQLFPLLKMVIFNRL